MKLLPQPNYSSDKENFKNKLRWSQDIILQVQRSLTVLKCKLLSYLHQSVQIYYVEKPNYKILITCEPFDFFGTTAKKFARTPCLFAAISVKTGEACALSSRGVSRRCYITTVTGNSWLQLDAIVDATFIDLLG